MGQDEDYKVFDSTMECYCQANGYSIVRSTNHTMSKSKLNTEEKNTIRWWTGYLLFSLYRDEKIGDVEHEHKNKGLVFAAREAVKTIMNASKTPGLETLLHFMKQGGRHELIIMKKSLLALYGISKQSNGFDSHLTKLNSLINAVRYSDKAKIAPFLLDYGRVKAAIITKAKKQKTVMKSLRQSERILQDKVLETHEQRMTDSYYQFAEAMESGRIEDLPVKSQVVEALSTFEKASNATRNYAKQIGKITEERGKLYSESSKAALTGRGGRKPTDRQLQDFSRNDLHLRAKLSNMRIQYLQRYDPTRIFSALDVKSATDKTLTITDLKKADNYTFVLDDFADKVLDKTHMQLIKSVITDYSVLVGQIKSTMED
jgi:hypothetical protein